MRLKSIGAVGILMSVISKSPSSMMTRVGSIVKKPAMEVELLIAPKI